MAALAKIMTGLFICLFVLLLGLLWYWHMCVDYDNPFIRTTRMNLKTLYNAALCFKMDTGRYPTKEEGLQALVKEPVDIAGWNPEGYLETGDVPQDAWGNDFIYVLNPESGRPFVIISYGANGRKGGEGLDADLYSTDMTGRGRGRQVLLVRARTALTDILRVGRAGEY